MGAQSYVKGGGSHTSVPVALNSKIDLYRSSKRLVSGNIQSKVDLSGRPFDPRNHKRIEWDIAPISEENYDNIKYEVNKLPNRTKIEMSIL